MQKPKMETSKKLLYLNYGIFAVLIIVIIYCTLTQIECSNLTTVASCMAAEVGCATSVYYTMCKRLNMPKVIKHIYDDLPEELRSQLDLNQLLSNISN